MKKLLLLGGNANQKVAIQYAKDLGYYTILCDYLHDNPGQYVADKTYFESTTDKEAVLQIAKCENIDGIISYASDVAAPTAAYVAEKLGLPGNPYHSVMALCNKDLFRTFLKENGFAVPKSYTISDLEDMCKISDELSCPVIVKPVDSSSSKGSTVLYDWDGLEQAVNFALSYSRCKRVIVEQYIERSHPFLIGGDIFVLNGQVIMWGLMNCHRDSRTNQLVPAGKSYPLALAEEEQIRVKNELQRLIDKLELKNTAMNVELVIDKNGSIFFIDIGPRCGGNNIPEFLTYVFGINEMDLFIKSAMGEQLAPEGHDGRLYCCTHNLHSDKTGILKSISFSEELEHFIFQKYFFAKPGDCVEYFDNAAKALGIIFMQFNSEEQMHSMYDRIYDHIFVEVEKNIETVKK